MAEIFTVFAFSIAAALALFLIAVVILRWVFLAPLIAELRKLQSQNEALHAAIEASHTTDEYASRQLTSIWHSVNMIRDGQRIESQPSASNDSN